MGVKSERLIESITEELNVGPVADPLRVEKNIFSQYFYIYFYYNIFLYNIFIFFSQYFYKYFNFYI